MEFVVHNNKWWWGESSIIVTKDGSGVVSLSLEDGIPDEMCIFGLSVVENRRREGIATALIAECERIAKERGMKQVYLCAEKGSFVFEWYKRLGYKKDKYRNKHLYRLTKIL